MQRHLSSRLKCATVLLVLTCCVATSANEPVINVIARDLKTRYDANEVHIPFMFLARFAVSTVRPAGVRSVKVKIFQHLNYDFNASSKEFSAFIQESLGHDWEPVVRVFARNELNETYVFVREDGKNLRLMVINLEHDGATIADVKINPASLAKFIENPKILGIPLS